MNSDKILFAAMAELSLINDSDDHDDKILNIMEALGIRSVKNNTSYILMTCMNPHGLNTSIAVLSQSLEIAAKELDTICSLIESIGQGMIKCSLVSDTSVVIRRCLDKNTSPINYLLSVLLKKHNKVQYSSVPHPIPVNPSHNLHTPKEYSYLSSILSRGSIAIGYLYSNPSISVKLGDEHVFRHIAIVGSTGSGKSTTASILAESAARAGHAVLIIDWHGEYENLLQQSKSILKYTNPLKGIIPEPLNLEELIKHEPLSFVEILESALELTPPQAHILEDAVNILSQKYTGNEYCMDVIIDIIQNSSASARWFTESREALLRKLKPLSGTYLNIKWNKLQKVAIDKEKICIFDISYIPNVRVKKVLSSLLIRSVILKAQYNDIEKPILLVVDEAHNIFHSENPLSTFVAEVRKWGIGFVIVTQAPSLLAPVVLKNTNTKIIHTLKSSSDIKVVISAAILKKEHKRIISSLRPGEALLVLPELEEPVLVKISRI